MAEICSVDRGTQNNFLVTQFINKSTTASEVGVVVDFIPGTCPTGSSDTGSACPSQFSLHIYNVAMEDPSGSRSLSSYNTITDHVLTGNESTVTAPMEGFYLAFKDTGACAVITRVRVTYTRCPMNTNRFAQYVEADSGQNVTGTCVSDSTLVGSSSLIAECHLNSDYDFSNAGGCECNAGYGTNGIMCEGE